MSTVTGLFPMNIFPVNLGVYQVLWGNSRKRYYARWNGRFWCCVNYSVESAKKERLKSFDCYRPITKGWCGLAEKP